MASNCNYSKIQKKYNEIKDLIKNYPTDLKELSSYFDLKIYNSNLPEGISGLYDRNNFSIYVNCKDDIKRQRFTVAHELGHHLLHNDKNQEILLRSNFDLKDHHRDIENNKINLMVTEKEGNDSMEIEANIFASWVLIPFKFLQDLPDSVLRDPYQIAKIFNVSVPVAKRRMDTIHLTDEYRSQVIDSINKLEIPKDFNLVKFN